jgi:hypothetical protein
MTTFLTPLHEACDMAKLAALVESFRSGRPVPAVAAQGDTALTGSHRVAAHEAAWRAWSRGGAGWEDAAEPTLDAVEVSEADYLAACRTLGVETHRDVEHYDLFAAALHAATEDEALRAALADQRGDYEDWTAADFVRYSEAR